MTIVATQKAPPPIYWLQHQTRAELIGLVHQYLYNCNPSHDDGYYWHRFSHVHGADFLRDGSTLCEKCFPHMLGFRVSDEQPE
jgi:hypothetical protein